MSTLINKSSKGFTLIELLVVIAIIGILSSVVLASLSTARAKSRNARRISDLGQIQLALELYYDSYAAYPTLATAAALTTQLDAHLASTTVTAYIPKVPKDPTNSGNYLYYYGTNASPSSVYSLGAVLERSDNPALTTDSDKTTYLAGAAASATNCLTAAGAVDVCYDISN